jgi:hypothetical protein
MLWVAMTPLLLLGLAVGLVPVTIGMVHDQRARQAGKEHSDPFFLPPLQIGGRVQQKVERQQDMSELDQRLAQIEATLGLVLARTEGRARGATPESA